jgi:hypothetical protein
MTNLNFLKFIDAKAMPVGPGYDSQRVKFHDTVGRSVLIQCMINIGQEAGGGKAGGWKQEAEKLKP